MPMVGGGMEQTLALLLQMSQQNRDRRMQQTQNLLGLAKPGETLSQLGITPRMFGQLTGQKNVDPAAFVPKPLTPQDILDQQQIKAFNAMTPEQISRIAASRTAKDLGQPQITTWEGLDSQAQASTIESRTRVTQAGTKETAAKTVDDLVKLGAESIRRAPIATREAAGQAATMGTTLSAIEADEVSNQLKSEVTREALKFAMNPQTHPLGILMKSRLKMDPVAAMAAVSTGLSQMLTDMNRLYIDQNLIGSQKESAIQVELARRAGDLSAATGFKVNPNEVYAVWAHRMSGTQITNPKLAELARIMDNTAELNFRAAMTEAVSKGDPNVKLLDLQMQMVRAAKSPEEAAQSSQIIKAVAGRIQAARELGPRPIIDPTARGEDLLQQTQKQRAWDAIAGRMGSQALGFIFSDKGITNFGRIEASGAGLPPAEIQIGTSAPRPAMGTGQPMPIGAPPPDATGPDPNSPLGQMLNRGGMPQVQMPPVPVVKPIKLPGDTPPDVAAALEDFIKAYQTTLVAPP